MQKNNQLYRHKDVSILMIFFLYTNIDVWVNMFLYKPTITPQNANEIKLGPHNSSIVLDSARIMHSYYPILAC